MRSELQRRFERALIRFACRFYTVHREYIAFCLLPEYFLKLTPMPVDKLQARLSAEQARLRAVYADTA